MATGHLFNALNVSSKEEDPFFLEGQMKNSIAQNDPIVFVVRQTMDYSKFKKIKGNRGLIDAHLVRLVRSFEQR